MIPIDYVDDDHLDFLVVFVGGVDRPIIIPKTLPQSVQARLIQEHYARYARDDDVGRRSLNEFQELSAQQGCGTSGAAGGAGKS
jgi:hypothetical protein